MSFLNRSENNLKPKSAASIIMECMVCKQETTYRKIVPKDFNAVNSREFNQTVKAMYNEIMKSKSPTQENK